MELIKSYTQTEKHADKSDKFVHITPQEVGAKLEAQGFELVSLKAGIAKKADRANHQTTLARFRYMPEALTNALGELHYEILVKIPHLYGAMEFYSGIFRVVCSNGLVLGAQFDGGRVAHMGDALDQVEETVYRLVASRSRSIEIADTMKQLPVDASTIRQFTKDAIKIRAPRLHSVDDSVLEYASKPRRLQDSDNDAWSVYNRVQEFLTRGSVPYIAEVEDGKLVKASTRRLVRPLSQASVDFNRELFDLATNTFKTA